MFGEYGQSYDTNTVFAGAATEPTGRISIWAPIERAKRLAICGLKFSSLMHWNASEEVYLDPDEARQAVEKDDFQRQTSRSCRGLGVQ